MVHLNSKSSSTLVMPWSRRNCHCECLPSKARSCDQKQLRFSTCRIHAAILKVRQVPKNAALSTWNWLRLNQDKEILDNVKPPLQGPSKAHMQQLLLLLAVLPTASESARSTILMSLYTFTLTGRFPARCLFASLCWERPGLRSVPNLSPFPLGIGSES